MTRIIKCELIFLVLFISTIINAQQVEVDGTLKVTQMTQDNSQDNIVIQNDDGTFGTRQSSSITSSPEIDTTRNLASDFALAKHMCECQNFPPFLIGSLLEKGYTESELIEAGIPISIMQNAEPIVDGDGNVYTAVTIGTQTWLQQNLKTTSKIDGTPIFLSSSSSDWSNVNSSGTPSYSYVNNSSSNTADYGVLYNWYTVEDDDVCPLGYRVPNQTDWIILDNQDSPDAILLKQKGFEYWIQPNQMSSNSSRFSARGAGYRREFWTYYDYNARGAWWSITESTGDNTRARFAEMWSTATDLSTSSFGNLKANGHSIRCIKN